MQRKIKKVAVLGSGVMGSAIAVHVAAAGVPVLLLDIVPPDLAPEEKENKEARNRIAAGSLASVLKAKPPLYMSKSDADLVEVGNFDDDLERIGDCDWIIEVVIENLDIKRSLFAKVEKCRKADAVVSTNTSGLPLKAISEGLTREFKEHFLGTHFFNPVRYMKLLEIIPGAETKKEILDFMAGYCEKELGKGIVWAKDTPNFIGNRIGVHGMAFAMNAMDEDGLSIQELDAIFGPPMGHPKSAYFKTADLVGLDTLAHVARNTYDLVEGDEQREVFKLPEWIGAMVEKKLLGNKTKAGFYKKEKGADGKKVSLVLDPKTLEYVPAERLKIPSVEKAKKAGDPEKRVKAMVNADDKYGRFAWKCFIGSCIYSINRIPEIADTVVEIDNGMKWGYNFDVGVFEGWDAVGVRASVERMKAEGIEVPSRVEEMLAAGCETFYKVEKGERYYYDFESRGYKPEELSPRLLLLSCLAARDKAVKQNPSARLVDLDDGVFCVEFRSKMNAIDPQIIDMLDESLDHVEENGVGLVIANQAQGMPPAFCAGFNIMLILMAARQKNWEQIDGLASKMQNAYQRLTYSDVPVVAAPYGLALGGGCEVSMAANRIRAGADLFMGLVEVGVGVVPAGCGCLNLLKRFQGSVPANMNPEDLLPFMTPVFQTIAMAQVSSSAANAREMGFLKQSDVISANADHLAADAKDEVLAMVKAGFKPPRPAKLKVLGEAGRAVVAVLLDGMVEGGWASEYDAVVARQVGKVLTGGCLPEGTVVDEQHILDLEREAFITLCGEEKTQKRIEHMLTTGRPLRN